MKSLLSGIIGIGIMFLFFNISYLAQPRTSNRVWNLVSLMWSSSPSETDTTKPVETTPVETTSAETMPVEITPGELKYLYIHNKKGEPVKLIELIRAKLGILYLAKDGKTLMFLATRTGQIYKIYKKQQPHLDKQILGS